MRETDVSCRREIARRKLDVRIQVDGGVDGKTVGACAAAGAGIMVAGTAVFRHPQGMVAAVSSLKAARSALDADLR